MLLLLASRVPRRRLMVAVTYRDIELGHSSALARTLEQLLRTGSISQIKLRGLGESEVALMLRGLSLQDPPGQLVKIIFDETQGNPFFIEELYKYLVEEGKVFDASGQFRLDVKVDEVDVPDKIRLVVGRRLDRLGKSGPRILAAGGAICRSLRFKLLWSTLSPVHVADLLTPNQPPEPVGLGFYTTASPKTAVPAVH